MTSWLRNELELEPTTGVSDTESLGGASTGSSISQSLHKDASSLMLGNAEGEGRVEPKGKRSEVSTAVNLSRQDS